MKAAEALRRLHRIRREARAILAAGPAPALAQTMQAVDRACHLAAWQLGDASSLVPEEGGAGGAGRPAAGRAARLRRPRRPRGR